MLQLNAIVRTSYGTGPYVITELSGPCSCNCSDERPHSTEPHYHIECQLVDRSRRGPYWLNGYRLDGTNVWSRDRLAFEGLAPGASANLFTEAAPGTNLSLF